MQDADVSVTDVALELNVTNGRVYQLLRGASPKADQIIKLADYFGVSTDWLLIGESDDTLLDPQEQFVLDTFRQLSKDGRKGLVKALLEVQYPRKKPP